jgi:hypothetical protein
MKLRTCAGGSSIQPMKKFLPILLLMLAGCANQKHASHGTPGFDEQSDWEEDKDFYYRSWYRPQEETAQEKKEYRDFYFGSWFKHQ